MPPLPQDFSAHFLLLRTKLILLHSHSMAIRFRKFNIETIILSLCSPYSNCVSCLIPVHNSVQNHVFNCHDSLVSFNEEFVNLSLPFMILVFLKIIGQLFYRLFLNLRLADVSSGMYSEL